MRRARVPWRHPAADMVSEPQGVWGRMVSRRVYTVVLLCMRFLSQAVAISSTVHTLRRMHLQLCGRKNQAALAQKRLGGRVAAPEVLQPRRTTQPHGSLVASATANAPSNTLVSLRQSALNAMALYATVPPRQGFH